MADNEIIINNSVFNNRIYAKEIRVDVTTGKIYRINDDQTREEIALDDNFIEAMQTGNPVHIAVLTAIANATTPTADKLTTPRNISVSGGATGTTSVGFDGSSNVDIDVTSLNASALTGTIPATVTIPASIISGTVSEATHSSNSDKLSNARTIALSGTDISGTATSFDGSTNISIPTTLSNTGVTSGTYGSGLDQQNKIKIPQIQIDNKGRILSANNVEVSIMPPTSFMWDNITNKPTTISGYGITDAYISGNNIKIGSNTISVASPPINLSTSVSNVLGVSNGGTGVTSLNSLKSILGISSSISMEEGYMGLVPDDYEEPTYWSPGGYTGCIIGSSTERVFEGSWSNNLLSLILNPTINGKHPSFVIGNIFGVKSRYNPMRVAIFPIKSISASLVSNTDISIAQDAAYENARSYGGGGTEDSNGVFGGTYLIYTNNIYNLNISLDTKLAQVTYSDAVEDPEHHLGIRIYISVFYQ